MSFQFSYWTTSCRASWYMRKWCGLIFRSFLHALFTLSTALSVILLVGVFVAAANTFKISLLAVATT